MERKKIDGIIRILIVAALLLLIGAVVIYGLYASMKIPKPTLAFEPTVGTSSEPELTQSEDVNPDRSKLFAYYDAELTNARGERVRLSDFRGKSVVLFFWSSWCGDCKQYFANGFQEAKQAAELNDAVFLMVCREGVRGESTRTASECLEKFNIECDTLMDEGATLFKQLGLNSVPTLAFISSDGMLMLTTNELLSASDIQKRVLYTSGKATEQTEAFIIKNLMNERGALASSYSLNPQQTLVAQDVQLAETQGLMMQYALKTENKVLFDQTFSFVENDLTFEGLSAWKKEDGEVLLANATLDDLRIVSALMRAQSLWGGYEQEFSLREDALWKAVVQNDWLVDFIEFEKEARAQETTLCYLDIDALDELAQYHSRWQPVRDKAYQLLENGLISQQFPLYHARYDVSQNTYTTSRLQMNEAMLTVFHAVRAGVVQECTLDYLESMLIEGPIYASYLTTGEPEPGYAYESTATYALLVQIGIASDRNTIARLALQRMEQYRQFGAPLVGAYGTTTDLVHHTFDDLQALLAWIAYDNST